MTSEANRVACLTFAVCAGCDKIRGAHSAAEITSYHRCIVSYHRCRVSYHRCTPITWFHKRSTRITLNISLLYCCFLDKPVWTFNRQIIQSEFSPTWSCVSLTRSTTSSEWKLFRFDKMEVNCFQILLIDVTYNFIFNMFKRWHLMC